MSDQPTPEPDDPAIDDSQLPAVERRKIADTAKALVDGTLRMDSDDFRALTARIRRRAWMRYQANFEDREAVRERNARQRASRENHEADVAQAELADQMRRRQEAEQRRRPRVATESSTAPGSGAAMEAMVARHITDDSPGA